MTDRNQWQEPTEPNTRALDEDDRSALSTLLGAVVSADAFRDIIDAEALPPRLLRIATARTDELVAAIRAYTASFVRVLTGEPSAVGELDRREVALAAARARLNSDVPDEAIHLGALFKRSDARRVKTGPPRPGIWERVKHHVRRVPRPSLETPGLAAALYKRGEELIADAALEELDLALEFNADGPLSVSWTRLSPVEADLYRTTALLDKAHNTAFSDTLVMLEFGAAKWWFEAVSALEERDEIGRETFNVRSTEWRTIDRTSLALAKSPLAAYLETWTFRDLGPRLRAAAPALTDSLTSLFIVRDCWGADLVLEDLAEGLEFRVRRHDLELDHHVGQLAVGRLMPHGDGRFFRSVGMHFLPETTLVRTPEQWGHYMRVTSYIAPPALVAELILSAILAGRDVTMSPLVSPVASGSDARELVTTLDATLEARGHSPTALQARDASKRLEHMFEDGACLRAFRRALLLQAQGT